MKIIRVNRSFKIKNSKINKSYDIIMKNNELVSFFFGKKQEYDFVKKNWGFYISPSINDRLKKNEFKIALVENEKKKIFLCAYSKKKIKQFKSYLKKDNQKKLFDISQKIIDKIK